MPIGKQEIEQEEVQKVLDQGVTEPCQNNLASPVVFITKKDGTTCFCVDYNQIE